MKPGYKQTEVGVIPEEWDVKSLGEIGEALIGLTYKPSDVRKHGTLVLRSSNIQNDSLAFDDNVFVETEIPERIMVRNDDVLICVRNGSRDLIGKSALLDERTRGMTFGAFMAVYRSQIGKLASYLFQSGILKRQINEHLGATINQITNKSINSFRIPVPPTNTEQRAIATALSDVDAFLAALDRLITKKRDLKQAAMQQLLTGQTRLPGFHGEWEVKRLGDVGEISSAGVDKKIRPDEVPVRLVNYLDVYRKDFIYSDDLNHWVTAPLQKAKRCAVLKGDVFFTPTSETRDDIGISAVAMEDIPDAAYSYHVARLRLHEPWDLCFRTYAFKTRAFLDQAKTLCDGNGTRYVISQGKFRSMTVQVPPLPEQTAIAEVLTEMDGELAVLEQRREKTRALKQAMMQELLTGRTRLL
jgi:type I restriction enzyme S subunit